MTRAQSPAPRHYRPATVRVERLELACACAFRKPAGGSDECPECGRKMERVG